ncbi:MAG: FkbM family methyltransferase, partial [Geobacteraceae bacterium]|nr:FkbM family methyltransferase [Geobacteraceae bacterium]
GGRAVEVQAVDVARMLRERAFQFVKMDIEGAEETVLPACGTCLDGVRFIFVEYHSPVGRRQRLDRILTVLADAGFRVSLQNVSSPRSPFLGVGEQGGFDLQLNIFGWRE